jgi:adenylate cyclase
MVVGNMGTLQKMDYTIMGNAVNLAARLEGVNKRYGTWILISEATQNELGTEFVTRRLDRIRVVGINKPVRLFELVEEPSHIDDRTGEGLLLFNEGLDLFEEWDWTGARDKFTSVFRHIPEDGPSTFFIERAEKFLKTPPPRDWDGVFNLTLK